MIAYIVEFRMPDSKRKTWYPVAIAGSEILSKDMLITRVKSELPLIRHCDVRLRTFHRMPGARVAGSVLGNIPVIKD